MNDNSKDHAHFQEFEPVSILADKVYAHYKQKECFQAVEVILPQEGYFEFVDITFHPGEIIENTLIITQIHNRPNFSRVRFTTKITFDLRIKNIKTGEIISIDGKMPDISKDIVLYIPEARNEFTFKIVIETASQILSEPKEEKGRLIFAIGVFMVIKVVGRVQLLIPEFGFCPEPPDCEEYLPNNDSDEFDLTPFPEFFPMQSKLDDHLSPE